MESCVDPKLGIILGYSWGARAEGFLLDNPNATLVRDEADLQTFSMPGPVKIGGYGLAASFDFILDELVSVRLDLPRHDNQDLDIAEGQDILEQLFDRFTDPPNDGGDGILRAHDGMTRMTVDLIDGHIVLEEAEP